MKSKIYHVKNRYNAIHTVEIIDKDTLKFVPSKECLMMRSGLGDNGIEFIDPDGGPFISVGDIPANVFHKDLSKQSIIKIEFNKPHYIIYLNNENKY